MTETEADALTAPNSSLQTRLHEIERLSHGIRRRQHAANGLQNNPPGAGPPPPQPLVNGNAAAVPQQIVHGLLPGAFFGNFHAHAAIARPTNYLVPGDNSQLIIVLLGDFISIRRAPNADENFFAAAWPYF